jgi:hypothetical protein
MSGLLSSARAPHVSAASKHAVKARRAAPADGDSEDNLFSFIDGANTLWKNSQLGIAMAKPNSARQPNLVYLIVVILALSCSGQSKAASTGDTVIQIDFIETHDRLPPDERTGIVAQHQIVATLSGSRVSENNQTVINTRRRGALVRHGQNNEALGDNSARAVWHVLGPHSLRRIFAGKQYLMMIDVEISGDKACGAQIKYLLQKGYNDIITTRADNGELAHFSLPRLVSAECSIH